MRTRRRFVKQLRFVIHILFQNERPALPANVICNARGTRDNVRGSYYSRVGVKQEFGVVKRFLKYYKYEINT